MPAALPREGGGIAEGDAARRIVKKLTHPEDRRRTTIAEEA